MVEFRNKDTVLDVWGVGKVTSDNLTQDLYERLIKMSSNYENYFRHKKKPDTKK